MRTEEETYRQGIVTTLGEILEQTKKTNGRVRALEVWRGYIVGGLAVVTTLLIPVLTILLQSRL